jgi:uncharacterized protein with PQ loop repeat
MTLELHHHSHEHIKNQEKFDLLHDKKYIRLLDRLVLLISILSPVFTLEQVYLIYTTKNVAGLAIFTWCAWFLFSIFWLLYGLAHKEKPIIINNIIWIVIHILVITGIIIYR